MFRWTFDVTRVVEERFSVEIDSPSRPSDKAAGDEASDPASVRVIKETVALRSWRQEQRAEENGGKR